MLPLLLLSAMAVLVSPLTAAPLTAAPLAMSPAVSHTPTAADLARARLPRPALDSHVVGGSAGAIFAAMNAHLARQPHHTRPCEAHTHAELNALARLLWPRRAAALDQLYAGRGDRRVLRGDIVDKERLWAAEAALAAAEPAVYGPGTDHHGVVRDGKCAELVMWWVHHLPAAARTALSAIEGFAVPLLPADGHTADLLHAKNAELGRQNGSAALPPHAAVYVSQVTCTNCHSSGNSSRPAVRPRPKTAGESTGALAVPAGTCPISKSTGKPTVWYEEMSDVGNRKKRCDWDYDPPCQPCEGIGGYSWGDGAGQITFIDCEPIANASSVPAANRTSPVWPLAFQVNEVTTLINQKNTGGRFPGADPCATHNFANDTETLYNDFDIILDHVPLISQLHPTPTRCGPCSTWLPCLLDADWCLRSDVMTDSCPQVLRRFEDQLPRRPHHVHQDLELADLDAADRRHVHQDLRRVLHLRLPA